MSEKQNATDPIEFLKKVYPDGPWCLTAIDPDKKAPIATATFNPQSKGECRAWIDERNGSRNLYWHVNPVTRPLSKKAEREDIKEVCFLHVDVDPGEGDLVKEQEDIFLMFLPVENAGKLPPDIPKPTAVIFSGGGYQAFWKLATPLPINGDLARAEDAKLYNIAMEDRFGGDNCHDISRIMRLPGTWNIPDAKKLKKGRTRAMAELVAWRPECVYAIESFKKAPPEGVTLGMDSTTRKASAVIIDTSNVVRFPDFDALSRWAIPDRIKVIMNKGEHPDPEEIESKRQKLGKPPSRSEWLYDVTCGLARAGVPDEVTYSIITDPDWAISESVVELKGGAHRYAIRQIERAKEQVANDNCQSDDWLKKRNEGLGFQCGEDGKFLKNWHNFGVALGHLGVTLRLNEFSGRTEVTGLPNQGPDLQDAGVLAIRELLEGRFRWHTGKEFADDGCTIVAMKHRYHPVKDYLHGLQWDGVPRIDTWLHEHFGVKDETYSRAVGALWLIAAVRRIKQPGCKFDELPIMESAQGNNKSSALKVMARTPEWFRDGVKLSDDIKTFMEQTAGAWLVEIAEMQGMRRGEVEHVKNTLSRDTDEARAAYGRRSERRPRQFVLFGTSNNDDYLKDTTGNRRFWPLKQTKPVDLQALKGVRDQLWAEAVHREAAGDSIRLDASLWAAAAVEQEKRMEVTSAQVALEAVLGERTGKIAEHQVLTLLGTPNVNVSQVRAIMKKMGWERKDQLRFQCYSGRRVAGFHRGTKAEQLTELTVFRHRSGEVELKAQAPHISALGRAQGAQVRAQELLNLDRPGEHIDTFAETIPLIINEEPPF